MSDEAPKTLALLAAGRHRLAREVDRQLRDRCGVDGGPIALGVSGGADSVALLLALAALRTRHRVRNRPFEPVAIHVHHHLRGGEADDDAAFVEHLGHRLGVPTRVEHIHPASGRGGLARAARDARYATLARVARSLAIGAVAVAHHADDQLETMLMMLARGAGARGLAGMAWRRPLERDVALVRPLLWVPRPECEAYCHACGFAWCTDSSNVSSRRGQLRRAVTDPLETIWPGAASHAAIASESLAAAAWAMDRVLAQTFGPAARRVWPRDTLIGLPPGLLGAGLRRAATDADADLAEKLGHRQIREVVDAIRRNDRVPRCFHWPGGMHVEVNARAAELHARETGV